MLIALIPAFFASIYTIKYWNYTSPPSRDIISPLVLLSLALSLLLLYPLSLTSILVFSSLILDSLADYYMDPFTLLPISLFVSSHLFRQLSFISFFSFSSISSFFLLFFIASFFIFSISFFSLLLSYSIVMFFTLINLLFIKGNLSLGFSLFVISDLIIAYEMLGYKINIRPIRVILVPLLFWLADLSLTLELLS